MKLVREEEMSSLITMLDSGLRETNRINLPQNLNVNRKRGPPEDDKLHYELKLESATPIQKIVQHSTMEEGNSEAGHDCLTADTIGRLVKDIWGEKVRIIRRGARGNTERHYLHLARREDFSEKMEIPKNWSCVAESLNETCFVRMESYLFNKQRAVTEVIVQEVDGVNAFYIWANGTEQCLSSVLNLDLVRNLDGEIKHRIAMVLKLIDTNCVNATSQRQEKRC